MSTPTQFVIVGEAECEAGKFLDEVQPEARRQARTINHREIETGEVLTDLAGVLRYVQQFGRLTAHEHDLVRASLARYDAWAGRKL